MPGLEEAPGLEDERLSMRCVAGLGAVAKGRRLGGMELLLAWLGRRHDHGIGEASLFV